ncbi:hypothetical protein [Sorangium sp. So ce1024]
MIHESADEDRRCQRALINRSRVESSTEIGSLPGLDAGGAA